MAMENMSLSDIAAVTDKCDNGFGGGSAWVLIILFALIFGWGGNGFGGNSTAAITEAQMCSMNNFTQLENAVGRLNDSQAQQNMMLSNGLCNLGYESLNQFGSLQRDLCTGFANGVAATNQAAFQARECCCETNRNIDQLRYDGALNTASINANTTEQTQKILDAIKDNQIAAMQNQINQLQLNNAMCGVVRYPQATTFSAGMNPYFSNGCGCCAA
jgi:hypothetical protein